MTWSRDSGRRREVRALNIDLTREKLVVRTETLLLESVQIVWQIKYGESPPPVKVLPQAVQCLNKKHARLVL
jgi:hypothetical protein